ncbi:MAG: Gfo/Idh/MocA family protein, partial [Thermomicrobiales bacterium]
DTRMLRVAILGAGFMGSTHARAFHALPDVEVAAIYAQSDRRAKPLADELGTVHTDDLDRILSDDSIDAVDISLPTPEHRRVAEAALAAGKHVLLEKPIALTLPDADALVDLAATTDRVFMIAHVLRFWPEYVELQRLVASGEYGRPVSAVAYRRQPSPAWSEQFKRAVTTGGAILDMLVHDYDMLNWIFGRPTSVTGRGRQSDQSGGWDYAQVMIDYDAASAVVDGGLMMPDSYPFTSALHVLCERGAVEYHFRAGGRSVEMGKGVNQLICYPAEGDPITIDVPQDDPYQTEIAYFAERVATGTLAARATPTAARLALHVGLAATRAVELGTVETIS